MNKSLTLIVLISILLNAESLFQVKDSTGSPVLDVSDNGMTILNASDTLMTITSEQIKAFVDQNASKGLSRSFSVTSTSSRKASNRVFSVTNDASYMWEGDTGERYMNFSPANIFLGLNAGKLNQNGLSNVFVGNEAGSSGGDISFNTFVGAQSGKYTTGIANSFFGSNSGQNNVAGTYNTYLGWGSGTSNSGDRNTYMGAMSGFNSSGSDNILIGFKAGNNIYGNNNIFIGNLIEGATHSNKLNIGDLLTGDFSTNALTVNGTLSVTGNTSVGGAFTSTGNATFASNAAVSGTYLKINTNPGTGTTPTNYVYQGATGSTSKGYAFAVNDALWVKSHTYIDGNTGMGTSAFGSHRLAVTGSNTGVAGVTGYFENTSTADGISLHAKNTNSNNSALALLVATAGTGDIVRFDSWHGDGTWDDEFRFDNDGDGYCDRSWHGGGADYAEYFPKDDTAIMYEPGDVIMISPVKSYSVAGAVNSKPGLLLGVYSDNPALVGNSPADDISHDNDVLVGLVGVIKTKVNTQNGPIKIGDYITISSTPKVGMKAVGSGVVIGRAMDNYDASGTGKINVFVDVENYTDHSEITELKMENELLRSEIDQIREYLGTMKKQGSGSK